MVTENTTPNRGYQEPAAGNTLKVDIDRLVSALRAIDIDVANALAAIVSKAGLASPVFTGTPTAPTAAPGTDSGQLATTAFVKAALVALVDSAPGALDTLNELAAAIGDDPNFAATMAALIGTKADAAATTAALALKADAAATTAALAGKQDAGALTFGQCVLTLSGGNLLLSRFGGRLLTINGASWIIPSAGITLAATGLTPSTLYYIYAFMNSGTMTLEASATVPATDATTGMRIKTGDATRTLVGMARPITGPAWVSSTSQQFVRSWYNSYSVRTGAAFSADRSTASSTLVELNTEIRNEFLAWGGEVIQGNFSGWGSVSGGGNAILRIDLDGSSPGFSRTGTTNSSLTALCPSGAFSLTEGYHYACMYASTTAGTFTVIGTGGAPGLLNCIIGN